MKLFALNASRTFAEKIAAALGVELSAHEEREFEDGEHKARPLVSVRGEDVYVVQSLHGGPDQSPNDKLCRLLFFIATLKENGAARVTAVIPYLAYARKDRQTKPRDPVTTRYVAELFEAAGAGRVVTLDVHNIAAFQNAFRCETIHLDTRRLFAARAITLFGDTPAVVASPDPGGVKRAQLFRERIEKELGRPVGGAFMEKRRSGGVVSGTLLVGDIVGATVLIIDDLISSGGTIARAAKACREGRAHAIYAFAAHGLFTGDAARVLRDSDLAKTFVTDTVPPFRLEKDVLAGSIEILSAAPLFAECILALHEGNSINALLEG
ncbi:MAG TPA: ribose-phosphate pyrophosphokinase [Methylocella sp.]|nr:ribose-phosphate pyrophosphokinase [Methylocella sp.]